MKYLIRLIRKLFLSKPKHGPRLFVGAHPDDEIHMAGIIQPGDIILIAKYGTHPVRSQEMRMAAQHLGCRLIHLDLDHPFDELPAAIAMAQTAHQITGIVTLDPVHGNYGDHHEHKAVSDRVIEYVDLCGYPAERVTFCTQIVRVPKRFGDFSNAIEMEPEQIYFEPTLGTFIDLRDKWKLIGQLIRIHASQFDDEIFTLFHAARHRAMSHITMDRWRDL
jgi:LmbE family N-acetylglucosaminyl deacetylase